MRIIEETNSEKKIYKIGYDKNKIKNLIDKIIEDYKKSIKRKHEVTISKQFNDESKMLEYINEIQRNHEGEYQSIKKIEGNNRTIYELEIFSYPEIINLLYNVIENDDINTVMKIILEQEITEQNEKYVNGRYRNLFINCIDSKQNNNVLIRPIDYIHYFLNRCVILENNDNSIEDDDYIVNIDDLKRARINIKKQTFELNRPLEKYKLYIKTKENNGEFYAPIVKDLNVLVKFIDYLENKYDILIITIKYIMDDIGMEETHVLSEKEKANLEPITPELFEIELEKFGIIKRKKIEKENIEDERRYRTREAKVDRKIKETAEKKYEEMILKGSKRNK